MSVLPRDSTRDVEARPIDRTPRRAGRAASLGVVALLAAALTLLALAPLAMPESYSWVELGLSEAGAQGIDGAWVARLGFIVFGLAVVWLARIRAAAWTAAATVCHLAFGASMFGVAAFAHKPWQEGARFVASEDALHTVFATIVGFGFIGGVCFVAIARRPHTLRGAVPDLIALAVALGVLLTMSLHAWGVFQRLMFLTAACWYGREALNAPSTGAPQAASRAASGG